MGINMKQVGPGCWRLDVHIRRRGREYRKRETFAGTKAQAEERYVALRHALRTGRDADRSLTVCTFGDVLRLYLDKRGDLPPADLSRFEILEQDLGQVRIEGFVDAFYAYMKLLRAQKSPRTGRPYANATINRFIEAAKAAFNVAVALELVDRNPVTRARFPKLKTIPRDVVLTEQELQRLFVALRKRVPHLVPMVTYALQVPCRRSELVNMRRADLDLFNMAIRIRNGTTKNDRGCWKPIPPNMHEYFRQLPDDCDYLFHRKDKAGTYHPLGDFYSSWQRCVKDAGIADFRFHDTRHMSATALLDNGTPEQVVMDVAGWATNMLKTYYHRGGKQSLSLVRFTPQQQCGHFRDTSAAVGA